MKLDSIETTESFKNQKNKKCPNCGEHFSFLYFLMRCGSDTLAVHHEAHKVRLREHRCPQCRKHYWVEYPIKVMQKEFEQYIFIPVGLGIIAFIGGYYFLSVGLAGAVCLAAITLFAVWPMVVSWVKYESVEIHALEDRSAA